jgi:hypothetical protein
MPESTLFAVRDLCIRPQVPSVRMYYCPHVFAFATVLLCTTCAYVLLCAHVYTCASVHPRAQICNCATVHQLIPTCYWCAQVYTSASVHPRAQICNCATMHQLIPTWVVCIIHTTHVLLVRPSVHMCFCVYMCNCATVHPCVKLCYYTPTSVHVQIVHLCTHVYTWTTIHPFVRMSFCAPTCTQLQLWSVNPPVSNASVQPSKCSYAVCNVRPRVRMRISFLVARALSWPPNCIWGFLMSTGNRQNWCQLKLFYRVPIMKIFKEQRIKCSPQMHRRSN